MADCSEICEGCGQGCGGCCDCCLALCDCSQFTAWDWISCYFCTRTCEQCCRDSENSRRKRDNELERKYGRPMGEGFAFPPQAEMKRFIF